MRGHFFKFYRKFEKKVWSGQRRKLLRAGKKELLLISFCSATYYAHTHPDISTQANFFLVSLTENFFALPRKTDWPASYQKKKLSFEIRYSSSYAMPTYTYLLDFLLTGHSFCLPKRICFELLHFSCFCCIHIVRDKNNSITLW